MLSDIEIAQKNVMEPISKIADGLGILPEELEQYGHYKAKISLDVLKRLQDKPNGKLVLVTAITPTPAGEGKSTTSIGLAQALNKVGKKAVVALREPSLGPVFGIKGGAAGGGYAQVVPMDDINLHFTGDMHAITAANNLLSAMIDNHIHHGNALRLDARQITWRRVMDMNDRALRNVVVGLGGKVCGFPRQDAFTITVASEIMAILCLAKDLEENIGSQVYHHIGQHLLLALRSFNPYKRNCCILNLICHFLIQLGAGLCQNLSGGGVNDIFRQGMAFNAILKCQFFIKFITAYFCQIISSGVKEHTVEQTLCTING